MRMTTAESLPRVWGTGGTGEREESGWPILPATLPTPRHPRLPQAASAGVTLSVCSPCLAERVADAGSGLLPAGPVARIFLLQPSLPSVCCRKRVLFCCVPYGPDC